ncbi:hypothetical protein ACHAW5_004973 [Stephanodiscus triporus]|uniref:Cell division cycle protein 123 n=1 Tax=Stephanodiscus triporus TaxID=2934178 RepID=A0ABD3N1Z7_9STRA
MAVFASVIIQYKATSRFDNAHGTIEPPIPTLPPSPPGGPDASGDDDDDDDDATSRFDNAHGTMSCQFHRFHLLPEHVQAEEERRGSHPRRRSSPRRRRDYSQARPSSGRRPRRTHAPSRVDSCRIARPSVVRSRSSLGCPRKVETIPMTTRIIPIVPPRIGSTKCEYAHMIAIEATSSYDAVNRQSPPSIINDAGLDRTSAPDDDDDDIAEDEMAQFPRTTRSRRAGDVEDRDIASDAIEATFLISGRREIVVVVGFAVDADGHGPRRRPAPPPPPADDGVAPPPRPTVPPPRTTEADAFASSLPPTTSPTSSSLGDDGGDEGATGAGRREEEREDDDALATSATAIVTMVGRRKRMGRHVARRDDDYNHHPDVGVFLACVIFLSERCCLISSCGEASLSADRTTPTTRSHSRPSPHIHKYDVEVSSSTSSSPLVAMTSSPLTDEDDDVRIFHPPRPTAFEVSACQFSSWYHAFRDMDRDDDDDGDQNVDDDGDDGRRNGGRRRKRRRNATIESTIIRPLSKEFLEYLLSDGVRLPSCATRVSSCMNDADDDVADGDDGDYYDDGEDDGGGGGGGGGGGCFPKLNWSAPRDASWINCGTLRCRKAGDVYLLLKSSDFVAFDLEKAWEGLRDEDEDEDKDETEDGSRVGTSPRRATSDGVGGVVAGMPPPEFEYELVLRKWCDLHPSMEFRCFVYDRELVSDDGSSRLHPHAVAVLAFFRSYVRDRFAGGAVRRYVVDVYLDVRGRVWIIDFNVWGGRTDALLFDWDELTALGARARDARVRTTGGIGDGDGVPIPEMRVVRKDMKSMTYDPLSSYRGPTDVVNLFGGDGGVGENGSFEEFMKRCVRPSEL